MSLLNCAKSQASVSKENDTTLNLCVIWTGEGGIPCYLLFCFGFCVVCVCVCVGVAGVGRRVCLVSARFTFATALGQDEIHGHQNWVRKTFNMDGTLAAVSEGSRPSGWARRSRRSRGWPPCGREGRKEGRRYTFLTQVCLQSDF